MDNPGSHNPHNDLVSDFAEAFEMFTEFTRSDANLKDLDWAIAAARAKAIVIHRGRNMRRNQEDGQS